MPQASIDLIGFNRGLISPLALARTDVEKTRLSAETMNNWMPRTQGAMSLRPGLQYMGSSLNDTGAEWVPFVASTSDVPLLEITNGKLRVWLDDTGGDKSVMARPLIATTITGGADTGTGWLRSLSGDATADHSSAGLTLNAVSRGGRALEYKKVALGASAVNKEHGLRIVVARGPVTFKCGIDTGDDSLISESVLYTGEHSLAFTPTDTGGFIIQFENTSQVDRIVTSVAIEDSGPVSITAPWTHSDIVNRRIRIAQSADVAFVACDGKQQRRIERRGTGRSWSVVKYQTDNGPFRGKTADGVLLKVAKTWGNTTLTADRPFFTSDHVGALFRLFHNGMKGQFRLGGNNQFTDPFLVSGITTTKGVVGKSDRVWKWYATGTFVGTVTMQRSLIDRDYGYVSEDYDTGDAGATFTTALGDTGAQRVVDDEEDNVDYFYRMGFKAGQYTSGSIILNLDYSGDGGYGICRVTGYTSPTVVSVEVLQDFRDTSYTDDWAEGSWSDVWGYPSAAALYNGRLWWGGGAQVFGSVPDDYHNFDPTTVGDAAPIARTIGEGPVDTINFMLPLQRMILGTLGNEISIRSTTFDEPVTATNMNAKEISTQGSAALPAVKVDNRAIFVHRSKKRVFEILYQLDVNDHVSVDLTSLNPDIAGESTIADVAVQRQPDTRVHFTLADGTVAILSYQPVDQLLCWSKMDSTGASGVIEKIVVQPGEDEDQVFFHVRRTVNGVTKRYLERMAKVSESIGDTARLLDAYIVVEGVTGTAVTGLSHLEGCTVRVWGGGQYLGEYTVMSGSIGLTTSLTNTDVVVGLSYTAQYKTTKLAYAAASGTALTQRKKVNYLGLILKDTYYNALTFGGDFTTMDDLPRIKDGDSVTEHTIHEHWDVDLTSFPGGWSTDARLCLQAEAPKPVTVLAGVIVMGTQDKI